MFTHILVGCDGSGQAMKAVRIAAELARQFEARLIAVNVYNPWMIAPIQEEQPLDMGLVARYVEQVQQDIEKQTCCKAAELGVECRFVRALGHPVDKITQVAEREKADLIVLGSRGLGVSEAALLGSVSDGVLHHAHCPVLIVR
ncbi:MAG TPA: universal stress protein [Chthonomonadaceae bacterium]|nr:universal stress protein [Chthonomonadaceae bacterium]